jgi:predicted Zn finger-like uncharacterized protein
MSSADLATVVITCPHCGTRYQVPPATLGAAGREVQCAQCGRSWHAVADAPPPPPIDPDALFTPADEAALDHAFESEARAGKPLPASLPRDPAHERTLAEIRAAIAPRPKQASVNAMDPAQLKKAVSSFDQRQKSINRTLPMARIRRTGRLGALVALLSVLILGFALRVDLVRWFPSLAGLYASIGLPVNVVGLDFEDSKTLSMLRDGKTVMQISARLRSVSSQPVSVPPVLVSLVNADGATLYEWTVAPKLAEMEPGDVIDFSTEVTSPPDGAVNVRLSFATKAS